ncbi:hypothetical protein ACHAXT_013348 [Thalassiosira profunda]
MCAGNKILLLVLASLSAGRAIDALEQNATVYVANANDLMRDRFDTSLKLLPAKEAVARVERGMGLTTHVVEFLSRGNSRAEHHWYVQDMVDAGLVSVLLNLLGQCDKSIEDVIETEGLLLPFVSDKMVTVKGEPVEGYLHDVTRWIEILCMLVDPNMRVGRKKMFYTKRKIARGIAPLVKCLYEDDVNARVLFRETEHWHNAHVPFANLLANLVGVREGEGYTPEMVPILMEHDGLVETLIRSIWWSELRPDIMGETSLNVKAIAQIAYYAGGALEQILVSHEREDDVTVFYEAEGKECNLKICNTIIVNEAYNPSSNTTFALGILDLLKGEKRNGVMEHKNFLGNDEMDNMLTVLLVSGCADPSIFSALVVCGDRDDIAYADAEDVMKHALEITHVFVPGKMFAPTDGRVAAAVEAGLIELMLKFLVQFKSRTDTFMLINYIGMILQSATAVSLRTRCTKAIASRRDSIAAALAAYEKDDRLPSGEDLQFRYKDIGKMIQSLLDLNQDLETTA